ncbi:glycoside hydrolase family 28 protein [Chitinophaga sancti]|uniref:Glycoside hydrolase family 28 protein n=1 Tax=Chitinophaga sancti TaxID=1004 RepID=A0A1K1R2M5_9BACT|nr:glycoside hydrolase family 28 protein [Chitinophaga sancti]WQD64347.1 glycoside hydrolase family 28 protein [Chitinophaga sancti]WQG90029.1 glycoside hydrolase family 28 protein [Chitinophaga sancti]SFW66188.1 Pectate lyase superfamily protein [Chitinophaga sancti]
MRQLLLLAVVCVLSLPALSQTHPIEYYLNKAPFPMQAIREPVIPSSRFVLSDYGAVEGGTVLNTAAFERVISACAAAGGGHVIVPAGTWLTGPIVLKSNVDLHVEKDALVLFTPDRTLYPLLPAGHRFEVAPPISGRDLENVSITGEGTFDGNGQSWRPLKKMKVTPAHWEKVVASGGVVSEDGKIWWPSKEAMNGERYVKTLKNGATAEDYLPARDFLRPKMVVITNSKRILIDGPTFRNSPNFVISPQKVSDLIIRHTHVFNESWAQNGDGIDISASKGVIIYHTTVSAGDDGICMKSSGDGSSAALSDILIAECIVYRAHGGFVIGSNTDGGMRNIYVTNCLFEGSDVGIRVKSNKGRGGLVKDIYIDSIRMVSIVNEAVSFDTYYEAATLTDAATVKIPEFCNFYISNIICNGAKTAMLFRGLPEMPVHDLHFKNVYIQAEKGVVATAIKDLQFKNVHFQTSQQPAIPPEAASFIKISL